MLLQKILLLLLIIFSIACHNVETGSTLTKADITRIKKLNLLDSNETIYKFYSEFRKKTAGNFFTNKRMASYWIDDHDKSKNRTSFAFYPDIISIDTVYNAGLTYAPYMLVTKKDSSQFKVCVEGKREQIKSFFEDAMKKWKENKKDK